MDSILFYSENEAFGYLSNFAAAPIFLKGKLWSTSEHYYQAQKFAGTIYEDAVRQAFSPLSAAEMGRRRSLPLRADWEQVRDDVMRAAVWAKFTQHHHLRKLLLATGEAELVEHTSRGDYWADGGDGSGKNMLGKILMETRAKMRAGALDWRSAPAPEPDVFVDPAQSDERLLVKRLLELYNYDFSEYDGEDVDAQGEFGYPYLDLYWKEPTRKAFILRYGGKVAGFALVRRLADTSDGRTVNSLAEFFVLRKFRGKGIGRAAARQLFESMPGTWRVGEIANNLPAQAFWRQVIGELTAGNFREISGLEGPLQEFRVELHHD